MRITYATFIRKNVNKMMRPMLQYFFNYLGYALATDTYMRKICISYTNATTYTPILV